MKATPSSSATSSYALPISRDSHAIHALCVRNPSSCRRRCHDSAAALRCDSHLPDGWFPDDDHRLCAASAVAIDGASVTTASATACLLATLLFGCGSAGALSPSGSPVGVTCIPSGCLSGAVYDAVLPLATIDPQNITVTVCRNEVCAKSQLSASGSGSYSGHIIGPLTVAITLDAQSGAFRVHAIGQPELLTDGDRYELAIEGAASSPLRSSIPFARYTRTSSNDPNCSASCISVPFPS